MLLIDIAKCALIMVLASFALIVIVMIVIVLIVVVMIVIVLIVVVMIVIVMIVVVRFVLFGMIAVATSCTRAKYWTWWVLKSWWSWCCNFAWMSSVPLVTARLVIAIETVCECDAWCAGEGGSNAATLHLIWSFV